MYKSLYLLAVALLATVADAGTKHPAAFKPKGCSPSKVGASGFKAEFYGSPNYKFVFSQAQDLSFVETFFVDAKPGYVGSTTNPSFQSTKVIYDNGSSGFKNDIFGLYLSGYFKATESGIHTFAVDGVDDTVLVRVGAGTAFDCCQSEIVTDGDYALWATKPLYHAKDSNTLDLVAGVYYPLSIFYIDIGTIHTLNFQVTTPSQKVLKDFSGVVFQAADAPSGEICPTSTSSTSSSVKPTPTPTPTPSSTASPIVEKPVSSTEPSSSSAEPTSSSAEPISSAEPTPSSSAVVEEPSSSSEAPVSSSSSSSVVATSSEIHSSSSSEPSASSFAPSTVTDIQTTTLVVTSCSDNKCTKVPKTTGYYTVTEWDTSYVTYCPLPTSTVTTTDIHTTHVTITSCSDHVCTEIPTTTGYYYVTEWDTSYVTYCPLPTSTVTTTDVHTTHVTVTSCSDHVCTEIPTTTGYYYVTEYGTSYVTYCPLPTVTVVPVVSEEYTVTIKPEEVSSVVVAPEVATTTCITVEGEVKTITIAPEVVYTSSAEAVAIDTTVTKQQTNTVEAVSVTPAVVAVGSTLTAVAPVSTSTKAAVAPVVVTAEGSGALNKISIFSVLSVLALAFF